MFISALRSHLSHCLIIETSVFRILPALSRLTSFMFTGGNNAENLLFAAHTDDSIMLIADRNMLFEYAWGTKSILNEMRSELNIKTVHVM